VEDAGPCSGQITNIRFFKQYYANQHSDRSRPHGAFSTFGLCTTCKRVPSYRGPITVITIKNTVHSLNHMSDVRWLSENIQCYLSILSWTPKVWNSAGRTHAGAGHD
jgi:hypothetical protein